jgi:AraC-like DNA-binding protein
MIEILNEFELKKTAYDIKIKGLIYILLSMLIRLNIITIPQKELKDYEFERLDRVLKYMEQHFSDDISLNEISKILNMNYSYVSRYFKKITGKSYKQYIDYIRICEAQKQILLKKRYIYQIAVDCGFASVQSFNRVYKRVMGYSPSEFKVSASS